ncbi:polysaccharide deacetylase [Helicobacter anseris]|uniref:Polysaccharide deacetylase n=1 Tax=Helicobacter anseris TaxID=375926 RepID=A0A3D8J8W5_9HELI|nr:polysaccharide deacetylase family protein [Helicobacter anseris]RDU73872.1 polysaccharide deacetylase [Helicobacter anseris]
MKQTIKNILSNLPYIKSYFHGDAIILMLHRIAPLDNKKLPENEKLKVDPKALENFIIEAKNNGYNFLSLDELYQKLIDGTFLNKKNLVITIDDGYKDNYTYGFPIFKKYQIPFCIYLCTGFLENPNMWWFSIEDFLLKNSSISLHTKKIDISNIKQKSEVFLNIRNEVLNKLDNLHNAKEILNIFGIKHCEKDYKSLALTIEEIQEMCQYKGFTLGCHTHTHPVFNNLSFEELRDDIKKSLNIIHETFGKTPKHFCFPFGGKGEINKTYCDFIKEFNFKTAVTTRNGTIYKTHKNYMHVLPRIFVHSDFKLKDLIKIRKKKIISY